MTKKPIRHQSTEGQPRPVVERTTFFRAVSEAEKRCGSAGKAVPNLTAEKALTLLALCTLAALDGIQPGARRLRVAASAEELAQTMERILTDEFYHPGPAFPYTKEAMAGAWKRDTFSLSEEDSAGR